jgi:uncharacterized phage infection (PIP) family protein YhgE
MSFLGSLTGANDLQNLENMFGSQGGSAMTSGTGLLQQGGSTLTSGINALSPALGMLTSLTKGDQGDVSQAAQPQIDSITQQFDQIRNMISQQPRGGGKTTALAEAPFQKSAAITRTEGDMRTAAAGQLGQLGLGIGNLGLGQEGVGLGEQGIGAQLEGQQLSAAEAKPSVLNQLDSLANLAGDVGGDISGFKHL